MPTNEPLPPLRVRQRELARMFSVCEKTITNWMPLGLPSEKVGGSRLFDPAEVSAWMKEHFSEQKTAPAATEADIQRNAEVTP